MSDVSCVFCRIAAGEAPAHRVWEDSAHVAFLTIDPIAAGHLVVVPRAHVDGVFDLEPAAYARLFACGRMLAGPVAAAAGAPRTGVAVEGFGVPHAHVHLVPVWKGNDLDPCRHAPAGEAELAAVAGRLRAAIRAPVA